MMSRSELSIVVVGASGLVGRELLTVLAERSFPAENVRVIAREDSVGDLVDFGEKSLGLEPLTDDSFSGADIVFFTAGSAVSREFAPIAIEAGAMVVDTSGAFSAIEEVPLVVPEVNAEQLRSVLRAVSGDRGFIVASPESTAIALSVVLSAIETYAGIRQVVVTTLESVSAAGKRGMDELWNQTVSVFNSQEPDVGVFEKRIAFNCVPKCEEFIDNGSTVVESRIVSECRRILDRPELRVSCTAVRVPLFSGVAGSVFVEIEDTLDLDALQGVLRSSPGIILQDHFAGESYPVPSEVIGGDATYLGRVRSDETSRTAFSFWFAMDNVRKGAALNAVQIAELLYRERMST